MKQPQTLYRKQNQFYSLFFLFNSPENAYNILMPITSANIVRELRSLANPAKATLLMRFFKTGKGEYAEGDLFWGIMVPQTRKVAKKYADIPLAEVKKLIAHRVHEVRLCALILLVQKYAEAPEQVYRLYMKSTKYINNWDLVDLSAPRIVGAYLFDKGTAALEALAVSKDLWERRIAILATAYFIPKGKCGPTFRIAEMLMDDRHDLIHKAVGWMLREAGKRCSREAEEEFLKKHAARMPRTMLRYAIERFSPDRKKYFMGMKKAL